jgi:N-acetylneuraminate synthase
MFIFVQSSVVTAQSIALGDDRIGPGNPTYVVAEMSGNHNRSYERALELVRAAKNAGANAVKLQTYTADTITLDTDAEPFRIPERGLWGGRTLHDLYAEASMPWEWQPKLLDEARRLGMTLFSAPFDLTAVDFLERIGMPAYKIASFEIVDLALVARVARTGRPMFISTGMASHDEIGEAVSTARAAGCDQIVLLKCTSAYPADPGDMHLRTIVDLERSFGLPVGLSDHTLGAAVPITAIALGACVVEKHFTLRRADGGPDSAFSLEAEELRDMIQQIRVAERALGSVRYGPTQAERDNLLFRRSLFIVEDVQAGDELTVKNVRSIRPGHGLAPKHLNDVLGRRAARDIKRGTPLSWELIAQ